MINANSLFSIQQALEATPTAAYSAVHDYPQSLQRYETTPHEPREKVKSPHMRLYAHIPFCNYSCSFCCYATLVGAKREKQERYVKALKKELEWIEPGTPLSQLFVGGGTPTALAPELMDEFLEALMERMPAYGNGVHTVEASPDSITDEHISVLKSRGIGRISMGIQSTEEDILDSVRRDHSKNVALEACEKIINAGFILNIDLIYGLPEQSTASLYKDFEVVAEAGVHAVTAYNLRLNEKTSIARKMTSEDRFNLEKLMDWRAFVSNTAKEFGYQQTRWHTFKRMDSIAKRHEKVAVFGDDWKGHQLGIGMSARSSLNHTMYRNHKNINTYMERIEKGLSPVEEKFELNEADVKTQYIANTLGDGRGLNTSDYKAIFNSSFEEDFSDTLKGLHDAQLLESDGQSVRMTDTGRLLYDLITLSFYPEHAKKFLLEKLDKFQLTAVN